jgi:hypothetical protein
MVVGKLLLAAAMAATALAAPAVEERAVRTNKLHIKDVVGRQQNGGTGSGSGACAPLYGTCGGSSSPNSPTCCESGSYCNALNSYYSQCVPGSGPGGGSAGNGSTTVMGGEGGESQQPSAQPSIAEPSPSSEPIVMSTSAASGEGMSSYPTGAVTGAASLPGTYPIGAASDTPASAAAASDTGMPVSTDAASPSVVASGPMTTFPNATASAGAGSSGAVSAEWRER